MLQVYDKYYSDTFITIKVVAEEIFSAVSILQIKALQKCAT